MTRKTKTAAALAAVVAVGAIAAGTVAVNDVDNGSNLAAGEPHILNYTIAENQYVGVCAVVTPPEPDPCDAARGAIAYQLFAAIVNADQFKIWRKGAPGDMGRLCRVDAALPADQPRPCIGGVMANPQCSTPANPQPQIMKTFFGAALADAVQAYACAKGSGQPMSWMPSNPPAQASRTDKTPPSAPGPIQITPGG